MSVVLINVDFMLLTPFGEGWYRKFFLLLIAFFLLDSELVVDHGLRVRVHFEFGHVLGQGQELVVCLLHAWLRRELHLWLSTLWHMVIRRSIRLNSVEVLDVFRLACSLLPLLLVSQLCLQLKWLRHCKLGASPAVKGLCSFLLGDNREQVRRDRVSDIALGSVHCELVIEPKDFGFTELLLHFLLFL